MSSNFASSPRGSDLWPTALGALGAIVLCAAWFASAWSLPVALLGALTLRLARREQGGDLRALAVVAGVAALLALKDLSPSGSTVPWAWIGKLPGAAPVAESRQPERGVVLQIAGMIAGAGWMLVQLRFWFRDEPAARRWTAALVGLAAAASVWILLQPAGASAYGQRFQVGALASRNAMAVALAMAALVGAGAALQAWRDARANSAVPLAGGTAVTALAACMLGSRGALLALAVGGAFLALRRLRRSALKFFVVPVALAMLVAIIVAAPEAAARVGEAGNDYRFTLWRHAWIGWQLSPWLGSGVGTFAEAFALRSDLVPALGAIITHPDSSVVLLVFEHGVLGAGVLLAAGVWLACAGAAGADTSGRLLRDGARAAIVAWLVASFVDIALHRAALLAVGLPLLAIAWPVRAAGSGRGWPTFAFGGACFGLVVVAFVGVGRPITRGAAYEGERGETQLSPAAAAVLVQRPFDVPAHHALGLSALAADRPDLAAKHFSWIMALQPANEEAIAAYAGALHAANPDLAWPFWMHLFAHAEERGWARLEAAWRAGGREPLGYWREVTRARPDLLPLLANDASPAAQRCFEAWRAEPLSVQTRTPLRFVVPAFARWGDADGFGEWTRTAPRWSWEDGANAVELLVAHGRSDLAWPILTRMVPRRPLSETVARVVDPELTLRARPDDFGALAALLAEEKLSAERRLELLRRATSRPGCPAWFRIELGYLLAEQGNWAGGGELLRNVVRERAATQPRDW